MPHDCDPTTGTAALPTLYGVLVTYCRPDALEYYLDVLGRQTRRVDHLFVVDNAPTDRTRALVDQGRDRGCAGQVTHLAMASNLGPAGGFAEGLRAVLAVADDDDWVVLLDDDDPPPRDDLLEFVFRFACAEHQRDPRVGAAGRVGARFDHRRGRMVRLRDEQLVGTVDVDYIAGNQFPTIRVGAVRAVGPYRDDLFFGFEELEFGLRLRAAGYRVLIDGDFALQARARVNRLGNGFGRPRWSESAAPWRRYYSIRNLLVILRGHGDRRAALTLTATALAKTVVLASRHPRGAREHVGSALHAVIDGWRGRVGCRVPPPAKQS
jgi:glycosyltransferase involved in cell wall biosynthesis